ncbi:MAG: hypothetical protein RXO36_08050 [Candidatus Nanopusillus acidilobi]|jgi:hypothetical protein
MSSPASSPLNSFENMISDFITAVATVLDQIAQALIANASLLGWIVVYALAGGLVFAFLRRTPIVDRIVGFFRRIF